ncbi:MULTISPECIES: hypothetical protein [Pseudofrankia]|uniref:hypothetical protein n=1 Tax=Pseudofrankia TaxID=2994363 RepID=UPI000234B48E|nr:MULTISPECIES: hypothetical protein [Pseudofrankia]OHV38096.1 hypothetical protein BCD49_14025 [Pseudofrankia sp. EUN1h]
MTPSWWAGLTPLEETILCGDANHRLRWSEGELGTPDHDDPDGERTLAALGGQPMPCIQILDAWQRHRADLDVLLLASRGAADHLDPRAIGVTGGPGGLNVPARAVAATFGSPGPWPAPPGPPWPGAVSGGQGAFVSHSHFFYGGGFSHGGVSGPGPHQNDEPLPMLLRLPGALPDRLVATVVATWAQRIADDDPRVTAALPALHAALYGRALTAARGWLGGGATLDVRLAASPAAARRTDGVIAIELPFSWLRDVWARGFATLAGRFCLTAQPGPPGDWTFTTVAADFGQPQKVTLRTW